MKRLLVFIAAVLLPILGSAQAQINTKKVKIGDFTQKITKVVLTDNMFYDSILQDEIALRWRISPYEFCTLSEFEELKGNDEYYFLLTVNRKFKKETVPGLKYLTLVKGGPKAEKGIGAMLEIVSLPIGSAENPSGREADFFPAFLDIIQNFTLEAMEKDVNGYAGLSNYTLNLPDSQDMLIACSEDDLSDEITELFVRETFDQRMTIVTEDVIDKFIADPDVNVIVSYIAAPTDAQNGSYCYKMLIHNQSHKVYYFRKHKIGKKLGVGFLAEDMIRITSYRE
jgi:hypothetical protein